MSNVVVSILAGSAIPTRLVGAVEKAKDGSISITYSEAGQVKKQTKSFLTNEVVGYLAGEAGYVIALLNTPITKITGELVIKDGVRIVKTETGNVYLNQLPGVVFDTKEVEADSKEARAAERVSKVKVRGVARRTETTERATKSVSKDKPTSREERIAAKKSTRSKEEEVPAKKKKRNR